MVETDYLEHYGRLGMKWGQHIFGKDRPTMSYAEKLRSKQMKSVNRGIRKADKSIQKGVINPDSDKARYKAKKASENKSMLEAQLKNIKSKTVDELMEEHYSQVTKNKQMLINTGKQLAKATLATAGAIAIGTVARTAATAAAFGATIAFKGGSLVTDFGVNKDMLSAYLMGGHGGNVSFMGDTGNVKNGLDGSRYISWADGSISPILDDGNLGTNIQTYARGK